MCRLTQMCLNGCGRLICYPTATLKELLQKDYKIVDDPPPVGKDFNDFLLSYLKIARPKLKRERSDVR